MTQQTSQAVYDISLNYGEDLSLSSSGDLLLATGKNRGTQRVLRRLLTNTGDYIWHTEYGAGLQKFIGDPDSLDTFNQIKSLINSQILLESSVSKNPAPQILLQTIQSGLYCQINYNDASSEEAVVLTFNVGN